MGIEGDAEFPDGAEDVLLRCVAPDPQCLGDLVDRAPFKMTEGKRGALEGIQSLEGPGDLPAGFLACRQALGARRGRGHDLGQGIERLRSFAIGTASRRAQEIHGAVGDDPVEPRARVRTAFESTQVQVRAEKPFLHHFFGVLFVPRHAIGELVHTSALALDQGQKSLAARVHSMH